MSSNRDEFPAFTKRALADRAGHRCSICKAPTTGPSDEKPDGVTNVGIAAHITAAAPGKGARRYDQSLTTSERTGIENGIWLCSTCSILIDRDAARFSISTLRDIRRDHTEFSRLGTHTVTETGLIAIGPGIVAGGQIVRFAAAGVAVRLQFFLRGSADSLLAFVQRFDAHTPLARYIVLSEPGLGGLLAEAPALERDGTAWTVTFQWQAPAVRRSAPTMITMSRRTGEMLSGEECWRQCFETALEHTPGTWFADMDGGSYLSELYGVLRGSVWFEHLVKCEMVRLASIGAPASLGHKNDDCPPLQCVRQVLNVRIPDTTLVGERLTINVELDLEGHGNWSGTLRLFIYNPELLQKARAKAEWMRENIRRCENGQRILPTNLPPDGWKIGDAYPE